MSLSVLSKRRGELMGICTLFILLCHFVFADISFPDVIRYIILLSHVGVDGFFFLSGFGIWFALNKSGRYNYGQFYKRRYERLLLPFLILGIPYFAICTIANKQSILVYLFEISTLSGWSTGEGFWFVSITMFLYLVTPLVSLFERKLTKNKWIAPLVFMIIFLVFPQICRVLTKEENDFFYLIHGEMRFSFMYFLGYLIAPFSKEGKKVNFFAIAGILLAGLIISYIAFSDVAGRFFILLIFWIYCFIAEKFDNFFLKKPLEFFGIISLESYMFNHIFGVLLGFISDIQPFGRFIEYPVVLIAGTVAAYFLHKLTNLIFSHRSKKILV